MRSNLGPMPRVGAALPAVVLMAAVILAACAPAQAGIPIGDPAPAFSLPSVSGGEVSLSDYQGRPVLLFFHMAVG
jgi:cytochrome oxidase Cu insertion factor (SCO1/SenC/PrrC family)